MSEEPLTDPFLDRRCWGKTDSYVIALGDIVEYQNKMRGERQRDNQ